MGVRVCVNVRVRVRTRVKRPKSSTGVRACGGKEGHVLCNERGKRESHRHEVAYAHVSRGHKEGGRKRRVLADIRRAEERQGGGVTEWITPSRERAANHTLQRRGAFRGPGGCRRHPRETPCGPQAEAAMMSCAWVGGFVCVCVCVCACGWEGGWVYAVHQGLTV